MIAKIWIAAGLALLAAPAVAQQNTQCTTTFGVTNCTTTGSPTSGGINWELFKPVDIGDRFNKGYEQGQRIRQQVEERRLIAEQRQALAAQRVQLEQVANQAAAQQASEQAMFESTLAEARAQTMEAAKMLNAGDCKGAQTYALSVGNLPLATKVKDYCAK